jgi:hypothetical protein
MNNLDKAFEHINNNKFEVENISFRGKTIRLHINTKHAFEAAKIAASPNWKYPEKNECPDKSDYYLVVLIVDNKPVYKIDFWNNKNFENYDFYVQSWCELPIFNKA